MTISVKTFTALTNMYKAEVIKDTKMFQKGSPFFSMYDKLISSIQVDIEADDTDEDVLHKISTSIANIAQSDIYNDIHNMGIALSSNISKATSTLFGDVTNRVTDLNEDVRASLIRYHKSHGQEAVLGDYEEPDVEFNLLSWDKLTKGNNVGYVIERAYDLMGYKLDEENPYKHRYAARQTVENLTINKVELAEELTEDILNGLEKVITGLTRDELSHCLDCYVKPSSFSKLRNDIKNVYLNVKNLKDVLPTKREIETIKTFIAGIKQLQIPTSDETKNKLNSNLMTLTNACILGDYIFSEIKEYYKDTLVISPTTLNKDKIRAFKEAGGELIDIAYYLRIHFNVNNPLVTKESPFPGVGLTVENIVTNKTTTMQRVMRDNANIKTARKVYQTKAVNYCLNDVLMTYVKNVPESFIPEDIPKETFTNEGFRKIRDCLSGYDVDTDNIEKCLYNFIINLLYKNTFVETLYRYMGKETITYMGKVASMEEAPEDAMLDIETGAITTLLMDYLIKQHLE